jgi:hypothetical protein
MSEAFHFPLLATTLPVDVGASDNQWQRVSDMFLWTKASDPQCSLVYVDKIAMVKHVIS